MLARVPSPVVSSDAAPRRLDEPQTGRRSPGASDRLGCTQWRLGGGGGEPAASVAATPSRQPLASVRQNSPGIGGIRRTFSWQRGHRQAQRAAAKEAAVSAAKTLLASAPVLAPLLSAALPRLERTRLAMTDKAMLAALRAAAARPPPGPRPVHAAGSHEGGEGGRVSHPSQYRHDLRGGGRPGSDLHCHGVPRWPEP